MATLMGFQMLQETSSRNHTQDDEPPISTPGPFRATQVWNGIVDHLKTAVDVRTRKHMMRSYEDCFTGSDAVDVVCDYLEHENSEVKDVTREKIAKLCQYFLDHNILEDAQACSNAANKRAVFMDNNSHFYRFFSKDASSAQENVEESTDSSSDENAKPCKRRQSVDPLQQPAFDRKRKKRSSFGIGRTVRFDYRASLAEGRSSNLKGIQNPGFEDPHSALSAILTPTRRPLSSHNAQQDGSLQNNVGRESRRAKKLSKEVISDIWKEVIIQRILHLVELPHLDNLLSCAADYHYESAEHVERTLPSLATPRRRVSSRRNVSRPDINEIDPWLKAAFHCLEVNPEGAELKKEFSSSRPHAPGMIQARKLLLYRALVKLYTETRKDPLIPPLLMDIVTMILGALGGGKSSRAVELTQLCLLLLPAATRLKLRALLRFMGEASKKTSIKLVFQVDNRTNVCNTFHAAMISSPTMSAVQAKNLVSFFLDTQNRIFKVPDSVLKAVNTRIAQARFGEKDHCRVQFCEQVSMEEYDVCDRMYTDEALRQLMNSIIDNTKISLKEKKQKLKLLQKAHPDIYAQHFSDML